MRLHTRIVLVFALAAGLGFALLVDWLLDDLRPRYLATMEEAMVDAAVTLAGLVSAHSTTGALATAELSRAMEEASARRFEARIYELTKTNLHLRVTVTDARGLVVYDSAGGEAVGADHSRWNDVVRTLRGEYGARATQRNPGDPGTAVLHVAMPVLVEGRIVGVVTVAKPAESVRLFLASARREVIRASVVTGLGAVALAVVLAVWIVRPLGRLTTHARAVRDGQRPEPPRIRGGEMGELAHAFEEMREALEGKQYVERYVQALTHEMKSPLSAVRAAAELLEEDLPPDRRVNFVRNIRGETARMQDLVDRMLQLAALENRRALRDVAVVDLAALARETVESLAADALVREVRIACAGEPVAVAGETFLLRHALSNLLRNALEFSPRGGAVRVTVRRDGDTAEVRVEDAGPGIPDYALPRVFERFYSLPRPDTGRKSSGLGLPFVREAVALHGGTVELCNGAGGACAVLRLPVRQRDAA